jgi:hypothetical protein
MPKPQESARATINLNVVRLPSPTKTICGKEISCLNMHTCPCGKEVESEQFYGSRALLRRM